MPNSGIEPKFAIYKIAVLTVVLIRLGGGGEIDILRAVVH
jgi:hypothetical protein